MFMVHCRKCHIFVRLSAQNVVLICSQEEKHNLQKGKHKESTKKCVQRKQKGNHKEKQKETQRETFKHNLHKKGESNEQRISEKLA